MLDDQVAGRWAAYTRAVFTPWLLLALAFVVWLGFQTIQLVSEREQLKVLRVGQDSAIETATTLRSSLDAVATRTAKLAGDGNASARVIVEELRKRGVTIAPDGGTKAD